MSERAYLSQLSASAAAFTPTDERNKVTWGATHAAKSRGATLEVIRLVSSLLAVAFALGTFHFAVPAVSATLLAVVGWWSLRSSLAMSDRRAVVTALPDAIMRTIPFLKSGYLPFHAWNLARSAVAGVAAAPLESTAREGELVDEQSHLLSAFRVTLELLEENRGTAEQILTTFADEVRQTGRLLEIAGERLATSVRTFWLTTLLTGIAVGIALRHLPVSGGSDGFTDFIAGLAAILLVSFVVTGECSVTLLRRRLWRD